MTSTTLEVKGMTCEHCKAAVERALKKVPGVKTVMVNRTAGSASVEWDDAETPREILVSTVNELGYQAQ